MLFYRLERSLEDVIREEVPPQIKEVVNNVNPPVPCVTIPQSCLGLFAARMERQH